MEKNNCKVAMILSEYCHNDGRVEREAQALIDGGYNVTIFAIHKKGLAKSDGIITRIYLVVSKMLSKLDNTALIHALECVEYNVRVVFQLLKFKPQVCHIHNTRAMLAGVVYATLAPKTKLVYDSHELWSQVGHKETHPLMYKVSNVIERMLIKRMSKVITVSGSIADHMANDFNIPTPVVVRNIPSLPDIKNSDYLRRYFNLVGDSRKVVLYQGNISEGRNLQNAIKAMELTNNAVLVIMGRDTGGIKHKLIKLVKKLELQNKVFFHEEVPNWKLLEVTMSADIGIVPIKEICLSYKFCLPNKLFEYLMAGLPVVASNLPDMGQLVSKNNLGILFNPDNPNDIAKSIGEITADQSFFHTKVLDFRQRTNWQSEQKILLDLYKGVLDGKC